MLPARRHLPACALALAAAIAIAIAPAAPAAPSAPPPAPRVTAATYAPLDPADAATLRAALPALAPADRPPRAPSLPPASAQAAASSLSAAGPTAALLAEPRTAAAPTGPLTVRLEPEGEVAGPLPALSVSFDRPMRRAGQDPASLARLRPAVPGAWTWLGDRTLVFAPAAGALPRSTLFELTVAAGAAAADGTMLQRSEVTAFATTPPKVEAVFPSGGAMVQRSMLMALRFDQPVDPRAVAAASRLAWPSGSAAVRPAPPAALAAHPRLAAFLAAAPPGHAVALAAATPVPAGTPVTLRVGPGLAGREGPRATPSVATATFVTAPPLAVVHTRCGAGARCRPGDPWVVELDRPLDPAAFDPARVSVSPPLPGLAVSLRDRWLTVSGASTGGVRYEVVLAPGLRDAEGDPLDLPLSAHFAVDHADPALLGPAPPLRVDRLPGPAPALPLSAVNLDGVEVVVRRVAPSQWLDYLAFSAEAACGDASTPSPGEVVSTRRYPAAGPTDVPVALAVSLAEALPGGTGHLVVSAAPLLAPPPAVARPAAPTPAAPPGGTLPGLGPWFAPSAAAPALPAPPTLHRWVSVTRLGARAWVDGDALVVWAFDATDGAPRAGAEVTGSWGARAVADADGLAALPLADLPLAGRAYAVVRAGAEEALVVDGEHAFTATTPWRERGADAAVRWLVADGEGEPLAPGDVREVAGWVRVDPRAVAALGEVEGPPGTTGELQVRWETTDAAGRRVEAGRAAVVAGAFAFTAAAPPGVARGRGALTLTLAVGEEPVGAVSRPWTFGPAPEAEEPEGAVSRPWAFGPAPEAEERASLTGESPTSGGGAATVGVAGAAGGRRVAPGRGGAASERANLELERDQGVPSSPGEAPSLVVRVRAPFADGQGVAVYGVAGRRVARRVVLEGGEAVASWPEAGGPGRVAVAVVAAGGGAWALGELGLPGGAGAGSVSAALAPAGTPAVGAVGEVAVRVVDGAGRPVPGAAVLLVEGERLLGAASAAAACAALTGARRVEPGRFAAREGAALGAGGALVGAGRTDAEGRLVLAWRPARAGVRALAAWVDGGGPGCAHAEASAAVEGAPTVRWTWPQGMGSGDEVEGRLHVDNPSSQPREVRFVVGARGLVLPRGEGGRVVVAARGTLDVAVPLRAEGPGAAELAWAVAVEGQAERSVGREAIAVREAGARRVVGAHGALALGRGRGSEAWELPAAPVAREVAVTVATGPWVGLRGPVRALASRGDEGAAGRASRVIAWAALLAGGAELEGLGLSGRREVEAQIARDLEALRGLMGDDGAVGAWRRGEHQRAWLVAHVAHAVARAKAAGVRVPAALVAGARRGLGDLGRRARAEGASEGERRRVEAYGLYVRALGGDRDESAAAAIAAEAGAAGLEREAAAHLAGVVRAGRGGARAAREAAQRIEAALAGGGAALARGAAARAEVTWASRAREEAAALAAAVALGADAATVARGVDAVERALAGGEEGGPAAAAWAVVALSQAYAALDAERTEVEARVSGNGAELAAASLGGRARWVAGRSVVPAAASGALGVAVEGRGAPHWSVEASWVEAGPVDGAGIAVARRYEALDAAGDVTRVADGSWRIAAGARYAVVVTVAAAGEQAHAVVEDPLLPGAEGAVACGGERGSCRLYRAVLPRGATVLRYEARAGLRGRSTVPGPVARAGVAAAWGQGAADRVSVE